MSVGGFFKGAVSKGKQLGEDFMEGAVAAGRASKKAKSIIRSNERGLSRMAEIEKKYGDNISEDMATRIATSKFKAKLKIDKVNREMGGNAASRTFVPNANTMAAAAEGNRAKTVGAYMMQGGVGGAVAKTATGLVAAGTGARIITGRGGAITDNNGEFDIAGIPFL